MPDQYTTDHERQAYELGVQAATDAASWVLDGNTSPDHIRRMVSMLDDGDPQADDLLPACPDLSGERADAPTHASLYEEIIGENFHIAMSEAGLGSETLVGSVADAIADAWEAGVSHTFTTECERILRAALMIRVCACGQAAIAGMVDRCERCNAETDDAPHIYFVRKQAGIAGQFSVLARVGYTDEAPREVEFVGSVYGGPVVMRTGTVETFVSDPGRFGEFGENWVRRFFQEA